MKILNWVIKGSIGSFRVFYSLLAVVIILAAAYILGGYTFLVKGAWGSDMGSALSMAAWVDKYFPRIPFWYPLAGGGVSITHSYSVFSFYLVSILKRVTDLDLIQAFRVLGISSVPLMALGIYAFVALRFKNQTAALIASIFYLVSPIAWTWLFDWGFYAEAVSHIFVMPAVIFWDLFFTSFLDDTKGVRNRIYLALAVIFLSLGLLTHFGTGLSLMGFFGFYVLGYTIKEEGRKKIFVRGILALSLVGLLTLLATAFTIFPFYRYTEIATEAGLSERLSYEYFKYNELPASLLLGFQVPNKEDFVFGSRNISFPAVVTFFAILGILLSLQSSRHLTLALFTIYTLTLSINVNFLFWMSHHIPMFLASAFSKRYTLVLLRFVLPTLAALGAIRIFEVPFFWVKGKITGFIKRAFASLVGLALVIFTLYHFGGFPESGGFQYRFGAQGINLIWDESKEVCLPDGTCFDLEQLSLSGWPEFKVANSIPGSVSHLRQLEQILNRISGENPSARIDFSPYRSGLSMITPYYNIDRNLSQIHIYAANSSLIHRFWGGQSAAFYLDDPFYGQDSNFIKNLTHWFGLNYVFFAENTNSELLQKAGWEFWSGNQEEGVMKFSEENSLADGFKKPVVLVISQKSLDAYNQVFRLSSYGVLPYKDAFVVWGKGMIERYSLEELRHFDVLLLNGYTYKSWQKANKLLSEYVHGGGSVFIDTGWQYTVPDWETENALEIIPFKKLSWKDLGKTSDFALEDIEIGREVDVSQFGPLIYQDQPWKVSTSEKSDLKDWVRVILSVKDYPLIVVGKFGQGKVVWSGMNVFPHAKQGENIYYEELELLANLFSWLTEGKPKINFPVTYKREHPDKVEFIVGEDVPNGGFLLWKEAYHPDFQAKLITNNQTPITNLKTYRAGPGLVAIKLPKSALGDRVIYEYRQPLSEKTSSSLSLLAFLFLPAMVAEGFFLKGRVTRRAITILRTSLRKKFIKPLVNFWEKEDEV